MPYYQGDFYPGRRGDFYRGDPGFFSFLGGLAKRAVGFIPGVGPIASAAIGAAGAIIPRPKPGIIQTAAATGGALVKGTATAVARTVMKHPVLSAAAGAGVIGAMSGGAAGMHMARGRALAGGRRRRRMNVCNPRALRRSIRRTTGFAKLAMRTIHLIHPKKKVHFGGFKRHRRKAA